MEMYPNRNNRNLEQYSSRQLQLNEQSTDPQIAMCVRGPSLLLLSVLLRLVLGVCLLAVREVVLHRRRRRTDTHHATGEHCVRVVLRLGQVDAVRLQRRGEVGESQLALKGREKTSSSSKKDREPIASGSQPPPCLLCR